MRMGRQGRQENFKGINGIYRIGGREADSRRTECRRLPEAVRVRTESDPPEKLHFEGLFALGAYGDDAEAGASEVGEGPKVNLGVLR